MKTSFFSYKAAGVAKMLSFLLRSSLVPIVLVMWANVIHVSGQACLTGEMPPNTCFNAVSLGGNQGTLSNCSFNTFPIFFHHPSINRIDFKSLHVRVRLIGDAQFDPVYFGQPASQIYVGANVMTPFTSGLTSFTISSDGKTLDWIVQCSFLGAHRIAVGPFGSNPIFYAGIIGDPYSNNSDIVNVNFELTTISGLSQQGMQLPCPEDCCSLLANNFGIQTGGTPSFCSNSTIMGNVKFAAQFPAAPAAPEELLHSVEINNTGPSVSFDELDLRVRVTDEYETMPDFGFDYSTSPLGPPQSVSVIQDENGSSYPGETDTYYLRYTNGSLQNGTTLIADIMAFDPEGLENLLGRGSIVVEYIRIKIAGSTDCCKLNMVESEQSFKFVGDLPCAGDVPRLLINKLDNPPSGPCKTGFQIEFGNLGGGGIYLEQLYLEIDVETSGATVFSEIMPSDASLACINATQGSCPTGCVTFCGPNKIIIDFANTSNPLGVQNNDFFTLIFDGNNGGITNIQIKEARIKEVSKDPCIPNLVTSPSLILPIMKCDYCTGISASVKPYAGSEVLNTGCEAGFSLYLDLGTQVVDEISIQFDLELVGNEPVTITASKSDAFCDALPNSTCDPGPNASNCMEISGTTVTLHYCGGQITGMQRVDIVMSGAGMVNELDFTTLEVHPVGGQTCDVLYTGAVGVLPVLPTGPNCPHWNIQGVVTDENGNGIYNVNMCVTEDPLSQSLGEFTCTNPITSKFTTAAGAYQAPFQAPLNSSKSLTPMKNCKDDNGVTTFDMALILKYILDPIADPLGSPYKILAADANNSGTVTTFDNVLIRKIILQIDPAFTNNASWRFIDAEYSFPNPSNPWAFPFPEYTEVSYSEQSVQGASFDFIGVKIGDVNVSAEYDEPCTSSFAPDEEADDRSKSTLQLLTNNMQLKQGESGWVEFKTDAEQAIVAWQLGLFFDPSLVQVNEIYASPNLGDFDAKDNFGTTEIMDGKLRALWVSPDGRERHIPKGEAIFKLHVKALRSVSNISDVFRVDNSILHSLAYSEEGEEFPFNSALGNQDDSKPLVAELNSKIVTVVDPNPFTDRLSITLNLPDEDAVSIIIYDQLGRSVAKWEGKLKKGFGNVTFDDTTGWGQGVLSYVVRTTTSSCSGSILKF